MDTMLLASQLQDILIKKEPTLREKLFNNSVLSLSDEELVSILLGSGSSNSSLKKLSRKVLKAIDKSNDLEKNLRKIEGMGDSKISTIIAAVELGRRYHACIYGKINEPPDIIPYLKHYSTRKSEHFISVSLTGANEIINIRVVSIGTLMNTIVHPREVFANVIVDRAASVIFAHNHPSGDVEPSEDDIKLTYRLLEGASILGINVLDHIIFSQRNNYISMAEKGIIN